MVDHTYREILNQAQAWRDAHDTIVNAQDAIKRLWERGNFDHIVVTGCGSTHYLAMTAAALLQSETGVLARAVPASELLLHPEAVYGKRVRNPLMVAISRSAETSETVQAVQDFKTRFQGEVITISCYDDKPLNGLATLNLAALKGQEQSVAQTRSFSAMLVMAEGLAHVLNETPYTLQQFPDSADEWVETAHRLALDFADPERFQRVFYLGSGVRYGLACEAMLKMKEMSLTSAEAFHPMEFRHGPKSMVDDETLIVGLLNGDPRETAVIEEMRGLGGTVAALSPAAGEGILLDGPAHRPSLVYPLPFIQWLAYERSIRKGLDPDAPRHLEHVIIL